MKMSKVLSIVVIAVMLLASVSNIALAISVTPGDIGNNITGGNTKGIVTLGGKIIGFIQVVGTILAVAILAILGVKYMMGSAEEKAEYKKTFVPYIVGAVLVFAASNIATWIYNWADSI